MGGAKCPWCGAENGRKVPDHVVLLGDSEGSGLRAFRNFGPDGRVPSADPFERGIVKLHHMRDGTCCRVDH